MRLKPRTVLAVVLLLVATANAFSILPHCEPMAPSSVDVPVDYTFGIDYTFDRPKLNKVKYLMKAMSCELPNHKDIRLRAVHLNHGHFDRASDWFNSSEFPKEIESELVIPSEEFPTDSCTRLFNLFDRANIVYEGGRRQRIIVPMDGTVKRDCNMTAKFIQYFAGFAKKENFHFDEISFGSDHNETVAAIQTTWKAIDVNKKSLTKSKIIQDVYAYADLVQQIALWAENSLQVDAPNRLYVDTTIHPTTTGEPSTTEEPTTTAAVEETTTDYHQEPSTTPPPENSTIAVEEETTADYQQDNSTSPQPEAPSTTSEEDTTSDYHRDNSTSPLPENSTIAVEEESTSGYHLDHSSSPQPENSTTMEEEATADYHQDNSTSPLPENSTIVTEEETTSNYQLDNSTSPQPDNQTISIADETTEEPEETSTIPGNTTSEQTTGEDNVTDTTESPMTDASNVSSSKPPPIFLVRPAHLSKPKVGVLKGNVTAATSETPNIETTTYIAETSPNTTDSNTTAESNQTTVVAPKKEESSFWADNWIIFVCVAVVLLLALLCFFWCLCRRRKAKKAKQPGTYNPLKNEKNSDESVGSTSEISEMPGPTTKSQKADMRESILDENGYEAVMPNESLLEKEGLLKPWYPSGGAAGAPPSAENGQTDRLFQYNPAVGGDSSDRQVFGGPAATPPPQPRAPENADDPYSDAMKEPLKVDYAARANTPDPETTLEPSNKAKRRLAPSLDVKDVV